MKNRYTVSPVHGESRSLFHVVDGGAPEDCQPCIVVTLGMRGEADQLAWILSRQAERIRELESAAAVYVRTHEGYAQELKARIRELEGALARAVRFVEGYRAMHDGSAQDANPGARCACWHCHNSRGIGNSFGSTRPEDARRILAEGSVKP